MPIRGRTVGTATISRTSNIAPAARNICAAVSGKDGTEREVADEGMRRGWRSSCGAHNLEVATMVRRNVPRFRSRVKPEVAIIASRGSRADV